MVSFNATECWSDGNKLVDEIEQSLLDEFTASDQTSSSDDDDSSGTDDLTVGKVIISEYSDEESDDVQLHQVRLVLHLRGRT
jgi:hypothetical protein